MNLKKIVIIVKIIIFIADILILALGIGGIISKEITVNLLLAIIVIFSIFTYWIKKKKSE